MLERIVFVVGTLTTALAIGHAGDAAVNTKPPAAAEVAVPAPTADTLHGRLDKLDQRLASTRKDIDALMQQLGTVDEARVATTRTRLALLYRLEAGLVADIEHTRTALASVAITR